MTARFHVRSKANRQWWQAYLLPILLILLAWALYLYGLDSKSLWFDELGTLTNASWQGSWADTIQNPSTIPTLPKPPLFFLVTRVFLALGDLVFALRLPSVLFAALTIPLIYALGTALFGRLVGLLASFLLAIAPLQVRYAQEARMYAMLTFFCVLSLYLFWRAITTGEGRWWLGFVVVAALGLYIHQFALLTWAVMGLFVLWVLIHPAARRRFPIRIRTAVLAAAALVLALLPMIPLLLRGLASDDGLGAGAAPDWNLPSLLSAVRLFSGGTDLGVAVYLLLLALAVAVLVAKKREILALSLAWIVLPVILVLILPFGHAVLIRYYLFALPVYLLLVAYGLGVAIQRSGSWLRRLRFPSRFCPVVSGIGIAALLDVLVTISLLSITAYYGETKQDWRDATRLLQTVAQPGDTIYVNQDYNRTGILFYARKNSQAANPLTPASVQLLPADPVAAFPLASEHNYWLIVTYRDRFQPEGSFYAQLEPNHRLVPRFILSPANVPQDSDLLAPLSYANLAVIEVTTPNPPSIQFWAGDEALSSGACTRLSWSVENVREVYLNDQGVIGQDSREVCPSSTASYELKVVHLDGSVSLKTIEIEVNVP
jgi:4-amino-4-deoxy-L-arabinose transferase-like glycosyltransferase